LEIENHMFRNYLKIGVRNLLKNKLFSVINISGMAISIASFFIIALFIADELKFDKHVADYEFKYRIYNDYYSQDGSLRKAAMVPPMIAPTLMGDYPEVAYYTRFLNLQSKQLFQVGTSTYTEDKGGYVDPTIFEMFSLSLVEGEKTTALKDLNTMAISKSLARKYFGEKPALGQVIKVSGDDFTVNAVYEDFPPHAHLQLNYFLAIENLNHEIPERMKSWVWSQFHTYIALKKGTKEVQLEPKLKGFAERYAWPITKQIGAYYIPHLMRIDEIHLYATDHVWDIAVRGNAQTIYILSATAAFILIISVLNFINLSTARAVNRVKEVGVRKVVGAFRAQLIYQFISESVIIALIALLIGGLITELALPLLNAFTEKRIPTGVFLNPATLVSVLLFAVLVGIAAGAYPAFYISGYKPTQILSSRPSGKSGKTIFRKGLVVLQFILSFFLITASLVVADQHKYMRTKDMGFEKDNLIVLNLRGNMRQNMEATKNSFLDHPNVISGTLGYGLPGEAYAGDRITDKVTSKDVGISMLVADHDYIKTLGINVIAGRDFSKEFPSDEKHAFILSEKAAKLFGHTDPKEAIGHELAWNTWDPEDTLKQGKVIGVIRDIHLNSLRENITPIVIHVFPFGYSTLTLRIKNENLPATLAHLEATWKKFNDEWPFEYRFVDDNFDKLYKAEEKLATLFTFFTGFTIFVACLGLFGLVVYSTSQKYKEISIRKVLGAEDGALVLQLGKNYVVLICIAFFIAIPFSYYVANQWLQKFTYHIDVTPMLFVKAALFILIISLLTVGIQSFKAARANPVNALKEQ
jgi:putative ABC transport system permease protein